MRSALARKPLRVLFATFLAGVLATSCGGGYTTSAASNPQPAAAQLSVSPSAMNFGSMLVGNSQHQTGTLKAAGSSIKVSSASWSGSGYSLSGITFPTTIPAGSSVPFTVTFTPQASGSATGQISFLSNAPGSPTVVKLNGSASLSTQHSVDLSWNASSSQVAGYNVYRGVQSGGPYTKLNSALIGGVSFTDGSVQSGATYYYAATSVDSSNVESGYSNVATATIP